jgi:hypothetical protein
MRRDAIRIASFVVSRLTVLTFIGILFPIANFGYCQQPQPTVSCEFLNSSAVFVGTVTSTRDEPAMSRGDVSPDGWLYTLSVQKMFRGPNSKTIEVYTENANARFPLRVGNQYLLFANKFHGRFEITSCGNSASISDAKESVAALERLVIPVDALIEGHISFSRKDRGAHTNNVVVVIQGNGGTFKAISDSEGWFHLHVPPGKYSATIQQTAGPTFIPSNDSVDNPEHFIARRGRCSGLQFLGD